MSETDPFAPASSARRERTDVEGTSADVVFPKHDEWDGPRTLIDHATPMDGAEASEPVTAADAEPDVVVLETPAEDVEAQEVVEVEPEHQVETPSDAVVAPEPVEAPSDPEAALEAAGDPNVAAEEPAPDFDPGDHTVDEVNKYLKEADAAEVKRVRKLEKKGKNRSSIDWPE